MNDVPVVLGWNRSEIRVGLADPDAVYAAELGDLLSDPRLGLRLAAVVPDIPSLLAAVREGKIQAALVDAGLADELERLLAALREAGAARVILLVGELNDPRLPALAEQARAAGADLLYKYALGYTLVDAIRRLPVPGGNGRPAGMEGHRDRASALPEQGRLPQVLVVYSPKGGVGKSTLAVHLGLTYARRGLRTALADLAQFGSVACLLRLPQRGKGLSSVLTILRQEPGVAAAPRFVDYLREAMVAHRFPGGQLDVLVAAPALKADQFRAEDAEQLLGGLLRAGYDVVLVDTSSELSERNVGAFAAATRILLTLTPDIAAAWHCLQAMEVLQALLVPRERQVLVVNRLRRDVAFNLDEVRSLIGVPLAGILPEAPRRVQVPANRGRLVLPAGRFGYAAALRRLADRLCPQAGAPSPQQLPATPWVPAPGRREGVAWPSSR